ncbi:hypothetical protein A7P54_03890 [Acinetobacter sp. Ac_3412]|uniref:hypothetical protein n=1 Tax=Acinetobacter sp. Ac_3412 TaxID=1848935 RepID=UPI00149002B1|nr:hypothetical protein [Acinetobacter sp. Ac_3412]NNP75561.1 hypothetical protein [Acinetobacter sp. Ac_3412]
MNDVLSRKVSVLYSISDDYYELSVETALRFGYKRITEGNYPFYRDECFVRYGKVWIHDLDELMTRMGITETDHPKLKNYNLRDYDKFQGELQDRELERFKIDCENHRLDQLENERQFLETTYPNFDEMSEYDQQYLRSRYRNKH